MKCLYLNESLDFESIKLISHLVFDHIFLQLDYLSRNVLILRKQIRANHLP
jgi:hypothetical protein